MTPLLPLGASPLHRSASWGEPPLEWADVRPPSYLEHELLFYG
jgi:hypothetical protein